MWGPLFDALRVSGRPVVAFDQRGDSPGARPEGVDAGHFVLREQPEAVVEAVLAQIEAGSEAR